MNFGGNYESLVAFLLVWTAKATVLLGIAFIAALFLRRRAAALRHRIWAIAIVSALMLPVVTLVIPAWHVLSPPPAVALNVSQISVVANIVEPSPAPVVPARRLDTEALVAAGLLLWVLGTMLIAFRLAMGLVRLWRISAFSRKASAGAVATLEELRANFGIRRTVRLLEAPNAVMMPMTWGILRPRIVLPADAAEWDDERRRIVVSHELAHVGRNDWPLQICAEAMRACFWFHPLAWIAANLMRQESERACDDAVLNSGVAAPEYAGQLLALARSLKTPDWRFSLALAIARPSNLERRFAAMLDCTVSRNPLSRRISLAGILLGAALLLPLAALTLSAKPLPLIQPQPGRSSAISVPSNRSSVADRGTHAALGTTTKMADEWPAGRGRTAFLATCSSCHAPDDVKGQNLDSRGWADVINRMKGWGAQESDEDFAAILHYLTTNFGPKSSSHVPMANLDTTQSRVAGPAQAITNASDGERAQGDSPQSVGSISGTVGDPSGAIVPGAIVTLVDVATGQEEQVTAGSAGEFAFSNEIPDKYELSIQQPGFQVYKQEIQVSPDEQLELPELLLSIGDVATEVTVSASRSGSAGVQAAPSGMVPVAACPASLQAAQSAYKERRPVQASGPPRNRFRVPVGGVVDQAGLVRQTMPIYPDAARAAGIQGTVVMNAVIGKDGTPLSTCVASGPGLLARAALDAVSQWRYSPVLLDGQPVEVMTEITAVFTLRN